MLSTLHSKDGLPRNGGEFDFDLVYVCRSDTFPKFTADVSISGRQAPVQKETLAKAEEPVGESSFKVANSAKAQRDRIRSTDLQTSCSAAGQPELAHELVRELQNAFGQP